MQWKDPTRWEELKQGINCPMCLDFPQTENKFSYLVTELKQSYIRLPKNQYCYGYTIVAFKRHANELFELTPQELAEYWQDVSLVAQALNEIYHPAKIDYLIFGHHCPHLHCHLVLQTFDSDPSVAVKMDEKEVFLKPLEYKSMMKKLENKIKKLKKTIQVEHIRKISGSLPTPPEFVGRDIDEIIQEAKEEHFSKKYKKEINKF